MSRIRTTRKSKEKTSEPAAAVNQPQGTTSTSNGLSLAPTWNNSLIFLEDLNRISWYQRALKSNCDMPDAS